MGIVRNVSAGSHARVETVPTWVASLRDCGRTPAAKTTRIAICRSDLAIGMKGWRLEERKNSREQAATRNQHRSERTRGCCLSARRNPTKRAANARASKRRSEKRAS